MPDGLGRVAIVGLGVMGQCLGLALRRAGYAVVGHDADPDQSRAAKRVNAVSDTHWNLLETVDRADLVILAEPADAAQATLEVLARELQEMPVITDIAPLKGPVCRVAAGNDRLAGVFVGGHPLTWPVAPSADALASAHYVLTPGQGTGEVALTDVMAMVETTGATPLFMDAMEHDGIMWRSVGLAGLALAMGMATAPPELAEGASGLAQNLPSASADLAETAIEMLDAMRDPEDREVLTTVWARWQAQTEAILRGELRLSPLGGSIDLGANEAGPATVGRETFGWRRLIGAR